MISQDNDSEILMTNNTNSSNMTEIIITDCPICMNISDLVKLPCGHEICENCRKGIYPDDTGKKHCPFCRETYETIIQIKRTNNRISRETMVFVDRERSQNSIYSYLFCVACVFGTCICLNSKVI